MTHQNHKPGILPYQDLRSLAEQGWITARPSLEEDQFQPASIDLRLGKTAYRVRASFLPGPHMRVAEKLRQFRMHEINLEAGAVLEAGCVYIIPLMEEIRLPERTLALASPKSSTGRLDVFTRLIGDQSSHFDRLPEQYDGPLYLEVAPRTFSILVRPGNRLVQIRLQYGLPSRGQKTLETLQKSARLVNSDEVIFHADKGVAIRVDLAARTEELIGYRARKNSDVIDLDKLNHYDPRAFWEPLKAEKNHLILDPEAFYILSTREAVRVPEEYSAEMIPYDAETGAFRVHYAGFFDPGFGCQAKQGSKAVLEIRAYETPFLLDDGQIIGWLQYDPLTRPTKRVYGRNIGSSYEGQGLKLAKQFKPWPDSKHQPGPQQSQRQENQAQENRLKSDLAPEIPAANGGVPETPAPRQGQETGETNPVSP